VAATQRARFTTAQAVTVDAIAWHPRMPQLEARVTVGGVDPRGMARAVVAAA